MRPSDAEPGPDRGGRVTVLDDEFDLGRSRTEAGVVSAAPRSSRTRSFTNGSCRAAGFSAAQDRTVVLKIGPQGRQRHDHDDRREDEGEDEELDQAHRAVRAAAARAAGSARSGPDPAPRPRPPSRTRLRHTGGPGISGRAGLRRSGRSSAGLLGVWGPGHGRTTSGPCVEFILEDDGRRLAIHAGPIGVALGLGGRPTRSAALHRTETCLGQVTGQPFVPEGNRNRQDRQDGLGPGSASGPPGSPPGRPPRAATRRRVRPRGAPR